MKPATLASERYRLHGRCVRTGLKNSKKYAATGGCGFGFFEAVKSVAEAQMKSCTPCHAESPMGFVFTRYAP